MVSYEFELLQLNKNQSINPEYGSVPVASNSKPTTVKMVSDEAIDTDMSDKIVKTQEPPKEVKNEEPKPWYKRAWQKVEQAYESVATKAARATDWKWLLEHANSFKDVTDATAAELTEANAESKHTEIQKRTAEANAKIKDENLQREVAGRNIRKGNEVVQRSYAEGYHKFHPKNQAPVAGAVAEYAKNPEIVNVAIDNMKNCAVEAQAEVVNAVTVGVVANKSFTDEQKVACGSRVACEIKNLDESQQADAYTHTANNMHKYDKVVKEVQHQVANVASEPVRQKAMNNLQQSAYENVCQSFTTEAIKRAQEEFKAANAGVITAEQKEEIKLSIEKAIKEVENIDKKPVETVAPQFVSEVVKTQEAQKATSNPFESKTDEPVISVGVAKVSNETVKYNTRIEYIAAKYDLENCKSVDEFAKHIKKFSKNDLNNIFKNIGKSVQRQMFSVTSSPCLQAFMLKAGIVDYEEVKGDCLPGVKSVLKAFTLNHDIDYAIQRLNG